MATYTGIGFSSLKNPAEALREAAIAAKTQTQLAKSDLAIILMTPSHASEKDLAIIQQVLKPDKMIGAVTPWLILPAKGDDTGVAIFSFTSDSIATGVSLRQDLSIFPPQASGLALARDLASRMVDNKRCGALFFTDRPALPHTSLIRGLQEGLGRAFSIAGGISTGGTIFQDHLVQDAAAGVIFGGNATFAVGISHGWQPLGRPHIITDAEKNIIRTIDDTPAVNIYRHYFPEEMAVHPDGIPETIKLLYPLGISTETPREYILATPQQVLPDWAIVCHREIQAGSEAHLMIGDKDACRQALRSTAALVHEKMKGVHPKAAFVFASVSFRKLFGRTAHTELEHVKEILGLTLPVFGMYTYGELGALRAAGTAVDTQAHNSSVLIAALG